MFTPRINNCRQCDTEYTQENPWKLFCSAKCHSQHLGGLVTSPAAIKADQDANKAIGRAGIAKGVELRILREIGRQKALLIEATKRSDEANQLAVEKTLRAIQVTKDINANKAQVRVDAATSMDRLRAKYQAKAARKQAKSAI